MSICLSADGLSFALMGPAKDDRQEQKAYPIDPSLPLTANLKRLIADEALLRLNYRETDIRIAPTNYTLVPLEIFEDEQAEAIYYYNHDKRPMETVMYHILDRSNVVVVFAVDKSTLNLIHETWPDAHITAEIATLIEHFADMSNKSIAPERRMYVHINKRQTHLIAFDHRKLLFANTFECRETPDRLYYTLNAWKQLGFSQERDLLFLTGEEQNTQPLAESLKTFIQSVEITSMSI